MAKDGPIAQLYQRLKLAAPCCAHGGRRRQSGPGLNEQGYFTYRSGLVAAERLMAELRSGDEESPETQRVLRHELIIRDSAAPPAESTRASRSGSLFQGKTGRP
jgi:hypothetical protein